MNIVLYGNFVVDYCSEVHHAKSLEALGHKVIRLQETTVTTEQVHYEAIYADMLIWIHSHGFINKGKPMSEVLQNLKERNIPTVAYHLDLYMGLERWREYEGSDYFKVQHFFTVDRLMADWLNEKTSTTGHYIPAGVLHEEAYSLKLPQTNDVIFVGSRGYHKEWPYRPQLIDFLKKEYDTRFKHYGGDGLGVVRGPDLNKLYAQSKIVVGDTLSPNFTYPSYFSDRLFETIGRGGFLIFPYISGLYDYFKPDEIAVYKFGDLEDLKSTINYYLNHENIREKIRERGFKRVLAEHTYCHRWQSIIKIIQ